MPESPERLRGLACRTGLFLYSFAVITFSLCMQVLTNGVAEYSGAMQSLFILGTCMLGVGLPAQMIYLGRQLRAAARASAA